MFSNAQVRTQKLLRKRRPLLRLIIGSLVILGCLWLTRRIWLPWCFEYLDVTHAPIHADYIVILGGGETRRVAVAAELYNQGFAPRLLVSGTEP